jgi:excinuclease ABC subunit C
MSINEKTNKNIAKLPDAPGVYLFKRGKDILYIGKATSLKDRVRSYFNKDIVSTRSPLVSKMLEQFDHIDHIQTDSVLEALVLEAHLIKKYQPEANIKEKDNRSFNFVVITKEVFPRVLIVRGRELLNATLSEENKLGYEIAYSFGPFPNGSQLREAMKIVRKLFPYRDKCIPALEAKVGQKPKPCFNRQIGLCPGVCSGEISVEKYGEIIENIILFFEGNKKKLIKNLEKEMKALGKRREFEKANAVKKTIFTLNHIQDISLIKEDFETKAEVGFRIESYDIAHMSGQNVVGVMTVVEDGEIKKADYRKFKIKEDPGVNDTKALREVMTRRLAHIEWRIPDLVVVDGGVGQKNAIEKVLRENHQNIPVVSVVKDDRHKAREILGDKKWLKHEREIILSNSEAHRYAIGYHKQLRGRLV